MSGGPMKILIDADGCPVVDLTVNIARTFGIELLIVCDTAHYIEHTGTQTILVPTGMDAVDFTIANRVVEGDIVITQDYGLAAMILAKKGYAVNQNGFLYTEANIDQLLFRRHVVKSARKTGQRLKGPKKRKDEDDIQFEETMIKLCQQLLEQEGEN